MKLSKKQKKQIRQDIALCKSFDSRSGTQDAFRQLIAKYSVLDVNFTENITISGKAYAVGSEPDYRPELQAIVAKLETYLLLGRIDRNTVEETAKRNRRNKIWVALIPILGSIITLIISICFGR